MANCEDNVPRRLIESKNNFNLSQGRLLINYIDHIDFFPNQFFFKSIILFRSCRD